MNCVVEIKKIKFINRIRESGGPLFKNKNDVKCVGRIEMTINAE